MRLFEKIMILMHHWIIDFFFYSGHIEIEVTPCTSKGSPLGEDDFLDDPKELVIN